MNKIISSKSAKIAAGLVGLIAGFAMIATTASAATFTTNLKQGSTSADVKNLQVVLNMNADTQVASVGAGSPGKETSYFGPATKAAVIKFQEKYASDILAPVGLTKGTGFVGASTRAHLNATSASTSTTSLPDGCSSATGFSPVNGQKCEATTTTTTATTSTVAGCTSTTGFSPVNGQKCDASTTTTTTSTSTVGGSLTIASATQPVNGLAIQNASRVAFTKVTLTAGSSDVVVNGLTVERTGAAIDSNFAGIVLLKEDGTQLDIAKTFGSNHQTIVGGTFVVPANTSLTLTVAGNMNASLVTSAGQVAAISVVAVNTTGTVSGSLPITGAYHTINGTLTIGTAVGSLSTYTPGVDATKAIGTSAYKFSGVRLTAGSAEDVRLKSIRFYQAGSVSAADLSNVKIYVDGTPYDTVSTDRYYSANFGSGIVISRGLAKDIWIQGDITGSGAAGRTIRFDIQKNTDLYVMGETYGQGIIAGGTIANATPSLQGNTITVSAGSFTSVTKATEVAAQNIAINLAGQVLGGYTMDITGETISVQNHVFTVTNSGASNVGYTLTSVSLYNENGAVVAGPVDAVSTGGTTQTVTFTDTVTYPLGKHVYTLKGKVAAGVLNGVTYSTVATSMGNIMGQTTGNTIASPILGFIMNTMTVKSAALALTMSTNPAAQFVVAGGQGVVLANIQLDASQSGEDVRLSSIPLTFTGAAGQFADVTSMQLFDGATALNTGSNVVVSAAATTITFDQALIVSKNTVKTLTLKGNVSSSATGTYAWNVATAPVTTGVVSGSAVSVTGAPTPSSATQTVGAGSLVVSTSPSTPSFAVAAAGSTGNTVGVIRFRSVNEGTNLSQLGLTLTGSTGDLVQVSLWDGATQVGTATFTGASTQATSTLTSTLALPKDADKDITVKVDFAQIGTGFTGVQGDTVSVNFYAAQGTGVNSGTTVNATGSTAVSGIRLFKSFPVVSADALTTTGAADGKLMRFKVTANSNGGVGLGQFKFTIATSTGIAGVANVNLYGYTDASYSSTIAGLTSGMVNSAANIVPGVGGAVTITPAAAVEIPAGVTYYFELRGTGTSGTVGSSITTNLLGDATAGVAVSAAATIAAANSLIWSGNATTTSPLTYLDWTNGYGVAGLPAGGLLQTRSN